MSDFDNFLRALWARSLKHFELQSFGMNEPHNTRDMPSELSEMTVDSTKVVDGQMKRIIVVPEQTILEGGFEIRTPPMFIANIGTDGIDDPAAYLGQFSSKEMRENLARLQKAIVRKMWDRKMMRVVRQWTPQNRVPYGPPVTYGPDNPIFTASPLSREADYTGTLALISTPNVNGVRAIRPEARI